MSETKAATRLPGARRLPCGTEPEIGKVEEMARLLEPVACFPMLSMRAPSVPCRTVPLLPFLRDQVMVALELQESLHRFDLVPGTGGQGLAAGHQMSLAPVGSLQGRLTPIPDDFFPGPGIVPPPTVLNPYRSQRFTLLNGELSFLDRRASGVQVFGSGRTFPIPLGGRPALRIGAVIDVLGGAGDLAGLPGETFPGATLVINGVLRPPGDLFLHLLLRVVDPSGRLTSGSPPLPMAPWPEPPDSRTAYVNLLGEVDPQRPVRLLFDPAGRPIGAQLFERLRLARVTDGIESSGRLCSRMERGAIVGSVSSMLYFDVTSPGRVIPAQTTGGVFTLHDPEGRTLGSLFANMVEGRAFRTALPGAAHPVYRLGGFGPVKGGTGCLADASGLMSVNALISLFPRTLSNLYTFRLADPDGALRKSLA
ncbi:MAG TPA: hypothetical protein DD490_15265 [Acidobacteria bacterium]|nr:hypothetical protein [Acidobacteriota bacterium]